MRWPLIWRLGAALYLTVSGAQAEPATTEGPLRTQAAKGAEGALASVVLVGAAGRDVELPILLRELLEHHGTTVAVTTAERFDANQLLGGSATGAVQVFVVPGRSSGVRLYFRAPDGERFLVRSVPSSSELDALGREQLGQIIETAVASLLQSTEGLTREQARAAVEREAREAVDVSTTPESQGVPTTETPPLAAAEPAEAPHAPKQDPASTTLEGWLALRYGASVNGSEVSLAHGPGLELGFGFLHRGLRLRARGVGQRNFSQRLSAAGVAATLETLQLALALDAGVSLGSRQWLLLSAGLGREDTQIQPSAIAGSAVAPEPAFQHTAPVAHVELRYEYGVSLVRAAFAAGADLALVDTHFDVVRSGKRERAVTPWIVQPTVSLSLGLAPSWQPF